MTVHAVLHAVLAPLALDSDGVFDARVSWGAGGALRSFVVRCDADSRARDAGWDVNQLREGEAVLRATGDYSLVTCEDCRASLVDVASSYLK